MKAKTGLLITVLVAAPALIKIFVLDDKKPTGRNSKQDGNQPAAVVNTLVVRSDRALSLGAAAKSRMSMEIVVVGGILTSLALTLCVCRLFILSFLKARRE